MVFRMKLDEFITKLEEIKKHINSDFKDAKVEGIIDLGDIEVDIEITKSWLDVSKKLAKKNGLKVSGDTITLRAKGHPEDILSTLVGNYDAWYKAAAKEVQEMRSKK